MKTMISKEHFNDITLANNYKPQFKKSGHLENINAFKHIWSH